MSEREVEMLTRSELIAALEMADAENAALKREIQDRLDDYADSVANRIRITSRAEAAEARIAELEAKLAAMFDIEESWDKCNIDEQDCLNRILGVLHFKEQGDE